MYKEEKEMRDIILKYENAYGVHKEANIRRIRDEITTETKCFYYTEIFANGFSYCRNW